jgi:hypothetical protein
MNFVDLEKTNREKEEEGLNLQRKIQVLRRKIRKSLLKLTAVKYDNFLILKGRIEKKFQKYADLLNQLEQKNQIYLSFISMNKFIIYAYVGKFRCELLTKMKFLYDCYCSNLVYQKCDKILKLASTIKDHKLQKKLINFLNNHNFIK